MAIEALKENVSLHQLLGDEPNTDNGLSSDDLKAYFDRPSEIIRDYINNTVVPAVNQVNENADAAARTATGAKTAAETANQTADHAKQAADIALGIAEKTQEAQQKLEQSVADIEDATDEAQSTAERANKAVAAALASVQRLEDEQQDIHDAIDGKLPQITGAKPGQYPRIEEVDELGRVLRLEAVNAPEGGGLNNAARALLITILRNAVYDSDQSANITALENALASGGAEPDEPVTPEKTLTSISATYSGGEVTVGTAVNDLTGIVVTAHYSDGTSKAVTGYTLSGTIAEGENIITVTYQGKTAIFTVTGVAEPGEDEPETGDIHDGYISDGLEFRLDAIRNTTDGHDSSITTKRWDDVSGNGYATTMADSSAFAVHDTYIENLSRAQVKVASDDLRTKMLNGFTVEAVFQPSASDSTGVVFSVDNPVNSRLMFQSGQFRVPGSSTLHGTAMTNDNVIRHCTYVYDGSVIKMYHDGILDTTIDATIDVSAWAFVEFWGVQDWADVCSGTFNAVRIYPRVLSDDEIKTNYDNDITRFGTVNVEVT